MGLTGPAAWAVNAAECYILFWPSFLFHPKKNPTQERRGFTRKRFGCECCVLPSCCRRLGRTKAAGELWWKEMLVPSHPTRICSGVCMAVATWELWPEVASLGTTAPWAGRGGQAGGERSRGRAGAVGVWSVPDLSGQICPSGCSPMCSMTGVDRVSGPE